MAAKPCILLQVRATFAPKDLKQEKRDSTLTFTMAKLPDYTVFSFQKTEGVIRYQCWVVLEGMKKAQGRKKIPGQSVLARLLLKHDVERFGHRVA